MRLCRDLVQLLGQAWPLYRLETALGPYVLEQVLGGHSYPIPEGEKGYDARRIQTIWDVGANIGCAALWFHRNFPNAKLHAFEPGRAHNLFAKAITEWPDRSWLTLHPYGLSDQDGEFTMHLGGDPVMDSFCPVEPDLGTTKAQLRHAGRVAEELGPPDLLKIDAEGSEVYILRAMGDHALRAHLAFLEYHSHEWLCGIFDFFRDTHRLIHARTMGPEQGELAFLRKDNP